MEKQSHTDGLQQQKIDDTKIIFKLDSGAEINVLTNKIFKKILSTAGIKEKFS